MTRLLPAPLLLLFAALPAAAQEGAQDNAAQPAPTPETDAPNAADPATPVPEAENSVDAPPAGAAPDPVPARRAPAAPPAAADDPPPVADRTEPAEAPPDIAPAVLQPVPAAPAPAPADAARPTAVAADGAGAPARGWAWPLLGAGALAAGIAGARALRRRSGPRGRPASRSRVAEEPAPPASAPVPPPEPRARLEVAFRPSRVGLNLVTATAEGEFAVVNAGDLAAADVRFGALLLPAHARQAEELAALWAEGVTRPAVAPFALAPGEERRFRHLVTLPRAAIEPIDARGRPMFVPVVAISAVYDRGDGEGGQAGRAWVVGVDRGAGERLAPLWLDEPARTRDDVAARPHGAAVDR